MCFGPFKKKKSQQQAQAETHLKQAFRYRDPDKKEFDLNLAIQELKAAISLEPNAPLYHAVLAETYLQAPEAAVTHGINVGFRLTDSAHLGLSECERAIKLYERDPSLCPGDEWFALYYGGLDCPIYAYLCLGEKEKAKDRMRSMLSISSFSGSREPKMVELRQEDIEAIIEGLAVHVGELGKLMPDCGYTPGPFAFAEYHVSCVEFLESGDLASLVAEIAQEVKRLEPAVFQPGEARRHIEQAVMYQSLGKHKDAQKEVDRARQLTPDLAWWYRTLCELGS